ncbi:TPA: hypothetical protein L5W23_005264 [Pseudomonas aeruginosa]|nr:hypothetical protein [Pseudomonas aeruginosa]
MTYELFQYPDGKTNYQITNEFGEKTTITLDKWVADVLQLEIDDVHDRIQKAYDKVLKNKPELSRRERGNAVRKMAERSANGFQESKKKVLGWNDDEIFALL